MATVSQPLPTLEITAAADDMEISSQIGHMDNDIDLDLDLSVDHLGDPDGDYMLEDAASENGNTQSIADQDMNQEIMYEEDDNIVDSGAMEDDTLVLDEHLSDAGIDEPADASIADANEEEGELLQYDDDFGTIQNQDPILETQAPLLGNENEPSADHAQQPQTLSAQPTDVDGTRVRDFSQAEPSANDEFFLDSEDVLYDDSVPADTKTPALGEDDAGTSNGENTDVAPHEPTNENASAPNLSRGDVATSNATNQEQPLQSEDHVDAGGEIEAAAEGEAYEHETHDDTSSHDSQYHPIIVVYEDNEISLFPPSEQDEHETFFLQDRSLASQSIGELLKACREVLGGTISDEQELQVEIHDLDLTIGEESAHALSTSFSELLDVYLNLYSLDGVDQAQPLYVTLTTKTRFSARLSFLREAIADGRGMSQLWYPEADAEEYPNDQPEAEGDYHEKEAEVEGAGHAAEDHPAQNISANEVTQVVQEQDPSSPPINAPSVGTSFDAVSNVTLNKEAPIERQEASNVEGTSAGLQYDDPSNGSRPTEVSPSQPADATEAPDAQDSQHAISGVVDQNNVEVNAEVHEQDELELFDFGDQEEPEDHGSSGSSTVIGDGPSGQEDGKAPSASANAEQPRQLDEAEISTLTNENIDHGYGETVQEEAEGEAQYPADEHNGFSAEFEGDAFDLEEADADEMPVTGEFDHTLTGVEGEQPIDHEANVEATAPQATTDYQEEIWDDFLESEQPLGDQEGEYNEAVTWTNNDHNATHQQDFAASTETLVAGNDNREQQQPVDPTAVDDFDEITYDEDDDFGGDAANSNEPAATSHRPSESPPGKRSYTEHLEGDLDNESDQSAKRLRAT